MAGGKRGVPRSPGDGPPPGTPSPAAEDRLLVVALVEDEGAAAAPPAGRPLLRPLKLLYTSSRRPIICILLDAEVETVVAPPTCTGLLLCVGVRETKAIRMGLSFL